MAENFIDTAFTVLTQYISIQFILSTNLLTYLAIKIGEQFDKHKAYSGVEKQLVTLLVTIVLFVIFLIFKISTLDILILSSILSPFTYSVVIKKIFITLGIDLYRKDETNFLT